MSALLELHDIHAGHGEGEVLCGLGFAVGAGEIVSLLGRNGAGKSTTLQTIMGYLKPTAGKILWRGRDITGWKPQQAARGGIGYVPQEREIFPSLTVRENLTVAARPGRWSLAEIHRLFPRLAERAGNLGNQLSGGEQQMLAIARALMLNPDLLLLDEPSEGLAPLIVEEIIRAIETLRADGLAVLLVEQNLQAALDLAGRHHILARGEIVWSGTSQAISEDQSVLSRWLAV
jgi:branched-chain amino acid transport system ATP-binding protein